MSIRCIINIGLYLKYMQPKSDIPSSKLEYQRYATIIEPYLHRPGSLLESSLVCPLRAFPPKFFFSSCEN